MNTEIIIIYESIYNGNTEKIARAMAQKLGCRYIRPKQILTEDLTKYKVIGFGSGIYFGTHHPTIFEVVEKLEQHTQDVFIFSSRGAPVLGKYHSGLKNALQKKGKNILGEFSVRGYDETGPWLIIGGGNIGKPNESDLKKAGQFVSKTLAEHCIADPYKEIKTKLPVKEGQPNTYSFMDNGTPVILKGDFVTINQTSCTGCMKCARVCPLQVIQMEDSKATPVNELDCTLCRLCIQNCVERAITLHYSWRDAIKVAKRHGKRVSL
ncbi:MAG: EFR1 family ferrodoxin [Prolixibacteraceae bacterium]|nr:EFR1 family ferrodoxin [Prolixibacteraceae bacterium]